MNPQAITFNGRRLFGPGEHILEPGSPERDSADKAMPGLDGTAGVDLGRRGRDIRQHGYLAGADTAELAERIVRIESYIDGLAYRLTDGRGRAYDNVRMTRFRVSPVQCCGRVVRCRYTIDYRQLSGE